MNTTIKQRIFIYESDPQLAFSLKEILDSVNFEADVFENTEDGYAAYLTMRYDLYILELSPENSIGFNVGTTLRLMNPSIPVLLLIPQLLRDVCLMDYRDGEPGYLTKPFGIGELLSRIDSMIYGSYHCIAGIYGNFQVGTYFLDSQKRMLSYQDEIQILTNKEAELLALFAGNANTLLERSFILEAVWTENTYLNSRSMDIYVTRLRKLLINDPDVILLNVHGKGYKLLMPLQDIR